MKSDYEVEDIIYHILAFIIPPTYQLFDCSEIITKVPIYAVERIKAVQKYGEKSTDSIYHTTAK